MSVDYDRLCAAVTGNPGVAEKILQELAPGGTLKGDEYILGTLDGKDGGSASIKLPALCGYDHATKETVKGPIALVVKLKKVTRQDAANYLVERLKAEGITIEAETGAEKANEAEYPWATAVQATTDADWRELGKFRGYPAALVDRIRAHEAVAKIDGFWCFPVRNANGFVIGLDQLTAHRLLDARQSKTVWKPKPLGVDRQKTWYTLGDPAAATTLVVAESRWDTLSVFGLYTDEELQKGVALLGAVGTGQTALKPSASVSTVVLAIQSDAPSRNWAKAIGRQLGTQTLRMAVLPQGVKDFNDLLRRGGLTRGLLDDAEPYSVRGDDLDKDNRPKYFAHGGPIDAEPAAIEAYRILATCGEAFNVRGIPMWLRVGRETEQLSVANFNLPFQNFAKVLHHRQGPRGFYIAQDKLNADQIKTVLISGEHRRLQKVNRILQRPNLVRVGGELLIPKAGYVEGCAEGPVFIIDGAEPLPEVDFETAVKTLAGLTEEWEFQSDADRSRMLAFILAPALQTAGFLPGSYPMAAFEAAEQGSGKSTLMGLITRIYRELPAVIGAIDTSKTKGVDTFDNSLSSALAENRRFNTIDNHRGDLKSTLLEQALTEGAVRIRSAYSKEATVQTHGLIFMLTTNGSTFTPDLMERSLAVRLNGKPKKWSMTQVERYELWEGMQPFLLSCVYTLIRKWHADGMPMGKAGAHRFKDWTRPLCGVVEGTCKKPSFLEGIEDDQARITDPILGWIRRVGIELRREDRSREVKRMGQTLFARDLADVCREQGLLPPGSEPAGPERLFSSIGYALKSLADRGSELNLGVFTVQTARKKDQHGQERQTVRFVELSHTEK
jgi:hypothetical protein